MSDSINENPFKINDGKSKKKSSMWSHEQEILLAEWAEKAACFRWLHSKAEIKYESSHYRFSIPIIVLSTLSGTANFGIDSVAPTSQASCDLREKLALDVEPQGQVYF